MYEVELRRIAVKILDKLEDPDYSRIITALLKIEQDPRPKGVEKLRGAELWRVREGDYRVIYHIDDESKKVTVVRIGHRRDVYRGIQ
jgi:mRNA interferase RelE/StbE